jgi:hypothetical protein
MTQANKRTHAKRLSSQDKGSAVGHLNFMEFVRFFEYGSTKSADFSDFSRHVMEVEIRNVYKMNYLKAVIGIRRSEGVGDKELEELKATYGDLMKDLPSEKLRDYQCAFAIFDLDNR